MNIDENEDNSFANPYDAEAETSGWKGPKIAFDFASPFIKPGQRILDIGIGTGLASDFFHNAGLHVFGMDISEEMLDICRRKNIAQELKKHDITAFPYPYKSHSMNIVVCVGVFQFVKVDPLIKEVNRILHRDGVFVFMVGDRKEGEPDKVTVDSEHTKTGSSVSLYLHSTEQINNLLMNNNFTLIQSTEFTVNMVRRTKTFPARVYLVKNKL